jgi:hypothetical protein
MSARCLSRVVPLTLRAPTFSSRSKHAKVPSRQRTTRVTRTLAEARRAAHQPRQTTMPRPSVAALLPAIFLLLIAATTASAADPTSRILLSSDGGQTWPTTAENLPATLPLPPPSAGEHALQARALGALAHASVAAATDTDGCAAATLVRWADAAGAVPFALGWTHSPYEAATARDCLDDAGVRVRMVNKVVWAVTPRWAAYVRRVTVEDARAAEAAATAGGAGEKARGGLRGWWAQWKNALLLPAVFVVVALGHGIYLGIVAVEDDEAAERRLREEQVRRGQASVGARMTVSVLKPPKKKKARR